MHILKILTVAFLMLEASGCACNALGCEDGLFVNVKKISVAWEPGTYVISSDADGKKATCTLELPFVNEPVCTSRELLQLQLPVTNSSDPNKGIDQILVVGNADKVTLTVTHAGTMVATQEYLPTYVDNDLNGPGCGTTCRSAGADLLVQ